MGKHDKHLPRRHLNKNTDPKGATKEEVKELAKEQGKGTKEDAKEAKKGGKP